jgi:solute carrier family 35, member F5
MLSLSFSLLWFSANYFAIACLEYTTVGSATILTSTSSIWTLLAGTYAGVERFTMRKLLGVLASLAGIVLISTIDVSAPDNTDRGTFPSKTAHEIAIGDALAFISAVIYGVYAVVLKKKVGDESRVNMPLFFGFVGAWNVLLMWPPFILLHFMGIERFEMPPTSRVVLILFVNSLSSVLSDFCWAFAMLLTSPLVVTVGLSLTIPLSLVGQMIIDGMYTSFVYWLGAAVVVASFVFVNHEEIKDEEHDGPEPAGLMRSEVGWAD